MKGTRKAAAHRVGRTASGAVFCIAALAVFVVLVPSLFGLQSYAIVSGSMSGSYDEGSLVIADVIAVRDLAVGDVITYRPPAGDHLITHRIASIERDQQGKPVFRTKGDANPIADPWTFHLDGATQARVRLGIPFAGHAVTALGRRDVRVGLIAFPAVLIAAFNLAGLWRRLGTMAAAT